MLESHLLHLLSPSHPTAHQYTQLGSLFHRKNLFILSLFGLFSSCSKQGYPLVTVLRLLFAGASFAVERGLQGGGLENPMDRGAWGTTVHGVAKSQT